MPASRSAPVETSYTKRITDALAAADDFVPLSGLVDITRLPATKLRGALHWLKKSKAINSLDSDGRLYWYLTPDADQRLRVIEEHRREDEKRTTRKRRAPPAAPGTV